MPPNARDLPLSLPKSWPRRVRSAVIHVISLAHFSLIATRSWAANNWNARVRLKSKNERLRQELALLHEEMRLKDARMQRIPAQRRPHYIPIERLEILELRAARGWSQAQTAERLLVTPLTVSSWMSRLDEGGPRAILQMRQPVNKFPDFVGYIVRRLKVLSPSLGKAKIAQILCRAGLHLGTTTVRRILRDAPRKTPTEASAVPTRIVAARRPNHVWHLDLTTFPTSLGFWTAWLPFALPQHWPFCWWLAVAFDHYSRRVVGVRSFPQQPSSKEVCIFVRRAVREAGVAPRHLVTDRGEQFRARTFRRWCRREGIAQRFGAVGKHGSIAVIERLIRTLKEECTRRLLVPYDRRSLRREIALYVSWYNSHRPHTLLGSRTPNEVYYGRPPACTAPRFEPRHSWPRGSPCATPLAPVRGRRGTRLNCHVSYLAGRKHLPIVTLDRAA
jgi:transposase InsO family protein